MNFSAKLLMNAAYGRFGMDDNFSYIEILTKDEYGIFEKANIDSIINVIPLGDNYLVQLKYKQNIIDTMLDNGSENHNVNISIASAVSAYARIHMSQFKNNPEFGNLYYSDTDSAFFDKPLPDSFINNTELGKMKLVGIYNKAIFIAPKVYILQLENNQVEIKIKGVTKKAVIDNNITLTLFENLLFEDYLYEIKQTKWFRSLTYSNITIKDQVYSLKVTGNKRELIYDYNNKLVGTKPFILPINDISNL
jgi:hypothetical protein